MADISTLVRSEIELAKAEVGKSAKKAGIGAGAFGAAGVVLAFSGFFFGIALAEFLTWLGLERWISYLIVWFLLVLLAGLAALVGRRFIKKIEKPERTIETLSRPARRPAPRGARPAAPRRARGQQRPGRAARQRVATRSEPPGDRPPGRAAGRDQRPAARALDPPRHLGQRHPAARRRGRRGPARAAAARLPAVLVDLARPADRPGRRRVPRGRPRPARLRRQRQAAARLRPAHRCRPTSPRWSGRSASATPSSSGTTGAALLGWTMAALHPRSVRRLVVLSMAHPRRLRAAMADARAAAGVRATPSASSCRACPSAG